MKTMKIKRSPKDEREEDDPRKFSKDRSSVIKPIFCKLFVEAECVRLFYIKDQCPEHNKRVFRKAGACDLL